MSDYKKFEAEVVYIDGEEVRMGLIYEQSNQGEDIFGSLTAAKKGKMAFDKEEEEG